MQNDVLRNISEINDTETCKKPKYTQASKYLLQN